MRIIQNRFLVKKIIIALLLIGSIISASAQIKLGSSGFGSTSTNTSGINYARPTEYEIAEIVIAGNRFFDGTALSNLSGLTVGQKINIPGDKISDAIDKLWKQGLFEDIQVNATKLEAGKVYLQIVVKESPRLSKFSFVGIRKGQADELKDKINFTKGKILTNNQLNTAIYKIKKYYKEKGYYNATVRIETNKDSLVPNSVTAKIYVDRNSRIKIHKIIVNGNKEVPTKKVRKFLKNTKQRKFYNVLGSSKYQENKFEEDKQKLIEKYNALGFRDAAVLNDSVYQYDKKNLNVVLNINEGNKFYFGNITFNGNSKYTSEQLSKILNIKKGEIFDQTLLDKRLNQSPTQQDVSSLYLDDGYLFFQANPIETKVYNDTIDLEIRIYEGQQATINRIIVRGNEKTNDKVIMREIRTRPGQKFSRAEIIRTQRELSTLGYFNPEKIGINPKPNPADGTVDIEYVVEEKPSDQVELSGGYGGGFFVGTVGLSFNNFSARNLFNGKAYSPLPSGDGQKLSIRGQSSGLFYQGLNLSFSEPWLGGKKPNYFTVSTFANIRRGGNLSISNIGKNESFLINRGFSLGLGRRLKFPDDFFVTNTSINFIEYRLKNYNQFIGFSSGTAYNINLSNVISRNSLDQLIYPRSGSNISFTTQLTLPYSALGFYNGVGKEGSERFKYLEYFKTKFDAGLYNRIAGNLVLYTHAQFGFLGFYDRKVGQQPFERFQMGGTGQFGFDFSGTTEFIPLRGYSDNTVVPEGRVGQGGSPIYTRYVMELRHPITLNQSATIFALGFAEAGNTFDRFRNYDPYRLRRSVGLGLRIFLPIFGKLGLDYGFGLDQINAGTNTKKGQFHFSINQEF